MDKAIQQGDAIECIQTSKIYDTGLHHLDAWKFLCERVEPLSTSEAARLELRQVMAVCHVREARIGAIASGKTFDTIEAMYAHHCLDQPRPLTWDNDEFEAYVADVPIRHPIHYQLDITDVTVSLPTDQLNLVLTILFYSLAIVLISFRSTSSAARTTFVFTRTAQQRHQCPWKRKAEYPIKPFRHF